MFVAVKLVEPNVVSHPPENLRICERERGRDLENVGSLECYFTIVNAEFPTITSI